MKKIFLKPPYAASYLQNGVFRINNGHNIFWKFNDALSKKQILINTIDLDTTGDGDSYVYTDVPYPWEVDVWKKIFAHTKRNILLCFESPIVNPFSHMKPIHRFFSKIYTWDDHIIDNKRYFKMYIPQLSTHINNKPKKIEDKKFLILINAKKSLPLPLRILSLPKINLFNERLKAINFLDTYAPDEFSLYGKGWNNPDLFIITESIIGFKRYKTYKGEIPNNKKNDVLSGFKYAICFENTSVNGYITEKIFDCFKARCVPVYWGASNIEKYIPKECFIDYRKFMNFDLLLSCLRNISEKTYNRHIEATDKFLSKHETRSKWFEDGFKKTFLEAIDA